LSRHSFAIMKPIIKAEGLGKKYYLGARETVAPTVREAIKQTIAHHAGWRRTLPIVWALDRISFEVYPGEVIGLIGHNGAGKSTLLRILARITRPTVGQADLFGRAGSLLGVGTGFHPDLTGRENIFLNGAILGMNRHEIVRKFDEIVAFAEVEDFLDTPAKRYSSGMYLRLGFAIAAHLEPEILLLDEVLTIADAPFQKKCLQKIREASRAGTTVLFVSHKLTSIEQLCDRVLHIQSGRILEEGKPAAVVGGYLNQIATEANGKDA